MLDNSLVSACQATIHDLLDLLVKKLTFAQCKAVILGGIHHYRQLRLFSPMSRDDACHYAQFSSTANLLKLHILR